MMEFLYHRLLPVPVSIAINSHALVSTKEDTAVHYKIYDTNTQKVSPKQAPKFRIEK